MAKRKEQPRLQVEEVRELRIKVRNIDRPALIDALLEAKIDYTPVTINGEMCSEIRIPIKDSTKEYVCFTLAWVCTKLGIEVSNAKYLTPTAITLRCDRCNGDGEVEDNGPKACPKCGGNGSIYHQCEKACEGYPNSDCPCSHALNSSL